MLRTLSAEEIRRGTDSIVLGQRTCARSIGFGGRKEQFNGTDDSAEFIGYAGDAHLTTVAPTRSGKGRSVIVPTLLSHKGAVIVNDPKGENYQVTARRRRDLGQQVVLLDPFLTLGTQTDCINPIDLFHLPGCDMECEAQSLADLLARGIRGTKEPFWDLNGVGLCSGLLASAASHPDKSKHQFRTIVDQLTCNDVVQNLAVHMDQVGKQISPMARREIASVLQMPEVTRGGVVATAQSYLKPFANDQVARSLGASTFNLQDVVDGKPLSIFIVIPPNRLHSHRGLLKLYFGILLTALLSRRKSPAEKTLIILDECAQLDSFPLLETLLTLSAGYGVRVHTFWQDLSQLLTHYPASWKNILNNCAVLQTFGIYNRDMAIQWGNYLSHGPGELRSLQPDEQILSIHGHDELRCRKMDYLQMACFAGLSDQNGFYNHSSVSHGETEPLVLDRSA